MFLGWLLLLPILSFHEAAHAYVAFKLGDPTAKIMGRLSLNPVRHIDLWGTIIIPLLLSVSGSSFVVGWAKPVPVSVWSFKNPRRDEALVALAGPVSNFLLAIGLAILFHLSGWGLFSLLCQMSLTLGVFNLIPVGPLDGFKVVSGLLPFNLSVEWEQLERYGMYLLIILMMTGFWGVLISWPVAMLSKLLLL